MATYTVGKPAVHKEIIARYKSKRNLATLPYFRRGLPSGPNGEKLVRRSAAYRSKSSVCRCTPSSERHENDMGDIGSFSAIAGWPIKLANFSNASCIRGWIAISSIWTFEHGRGTRSDINLA
jgi:hypothetical protein